MAEAATATKTLSSADRTGRTIEQSQGTTISVNTIYRLFVWLISHRPAVLFSQNKSAISNQPTILFSQNKSASATRQTDRVCAGRINQLRTPEIDVVCLRTNNFDTNIVNLSREIQLPKPLNMMSHTESQSNWQNRPRER
jgi:hypothetical protein